MKAKVPVKFGGSLELNGHAPELEDMVYPPYQYRIDEATGLVSPADDFTQGRNGPEVRALVSHPIAVPPYIVEVPKSMVQTKEQALSAHATQMNGTNYKAGIMGLDLLRGMALGEDKWGVGIYPIRVPGVTLPNSPFLEDLDPGSVFQLTRKEQVVAQQMKK